MKADGWATAFLSIGSMEGLKIAEKEKIAVMFIDKIDNNLTKFKSAEFENLK
jgi:thiamine biosynthesis lipoprotein ApbE